MARPRSPSHDRRRHPRRRRPHRPRGPSRVQSHVAGRHQAAGRLADRPCDASRAVLLDLLRRPDDEGLSRYKPFQIPRSRTAPATADASPTARRRIDARAGRRFAGNCTPGGGCRRDAAVVCKRRGLDRCRDHGRLATCCRVLRPGRCACPSVRGRPPRWRPRAAGRPAGDRRGRTPSSGPGWSLLDGVLVGRRAVVAAGVIARSGHRGSTTWCAERVIEGTVASRLVVPAGVGRHSGHEVAGRRLRGTTGSARRRPSSSRCATAAPTPGSPSRVPSGERASHARGAVGRTPSPRPATGPRRDPSRRSARRIRRGGPCRPVRHPLYVYDLDVVTRQVDCAAGPSCRRGSTWPTR